MNDVISPGLIVPSGSSESQRSHTVVASCVTGYNNDPDMVTVSLAVSRFQGQYTVDYGGMMAAATLVLLPQLIIYALFQRQVIAGMTVGAVKG